VVRKGLLGGGQAVWRLDLRRRRRPVTPNRGSRGILGRAKLPSPPREKSHQYSATVIKNKRKTRRKRKKRESETSGIFRLGGEKKPPGQRWRQVGTCQARPFSLRPQTAYQNRQERNQHPCKLLHDFLALAWKGKSAYHPDEQASQKTCERSGARQLGAKNKKLGAFPTVEGPRRKELTPRKSFRAGSQTQ